MDSLFQQLKKLYDSELYEQVLPIVSITKPAHAVFSLFQSNFSFATEST